MLQEASTVQRLPETQKEEEKGDCHGQLENLANFQIVT
jgi:hypothetical protein